LGRLRPYPAIIRLDWKCLPGTNTLSYYKNLQITAVKSFIVQISSIDVRVCQTLMRVIGSLFARSLANLAILASLASLASQLDPVESIMLFTSQLCLELEVQRVFCQTALQRYKTAG
jgi:hypothetical protein